ncbi:SDR family NAD(P)-dependent oxidoreductase [Rathayibacter sp. YIM 133350]|uniref:SDR family oxidoreductase n=1 Tax=Rathayibacter sp. YIM 133350 TaxID=3131992 RepID=UPI00307E41D7
MTVAGRTVLIAGATSVAGRAVAAALVDAGARVVSVGTNSERLAAVRSSRPEIVTELTDLTDEGAVRELATRVHENVGPVDGLIHLVGGWRGGGGLAGQSDEDYRALERSFTALRFGSRAFYDDLVGSDAGRLAIVSAAAVLHPTPGGANYVAVKAASEAWTHAVAAGFRKASPGSAAVIYRVKALAGLEGDLAASVVGLWNADAATLNDSEIALGE